MSTQNFMSYGDAETIFTDVQTKKFSTGNVSTIQSTLTASRAYNQNDPFIYNGQLYKADSAIASGGTIVISGTGQNASPTTIEELINLHSGSGGGHTILNSSGTAMTQRSKLQFVGATVTDDSANDKTIVTPTDTKNTAGSTDSSSKLFLIGATSQAANPKTYSQDTAYVGTDGNLYSGSKIVATQNMIGDAWASGQSYAVGDYRIDGNVLYRCKTAHTSTASNRPPYASYWEVTPVANQLGGGVNILDKTTRFVNLINPSLNYITNNTASTVKAIDSNKLILERTGYGGSKYPFVVYPKTITVSGTTYLHLERVRGTKIYNVDTFGGYIGFDTSLNGIYTWAHDGSWDKGVNMETGGYISVPAGTYYFYNVYYNGATNDGQPPYTLIFEGFYLVSTNQIIIN